MPSVRLKCGDKVVITRSWSSDVLPGYEGFIEKRMKGGYSVIITATFCDALGKRRVETRHMYFAFREVRRVA